MITEDYVSFEVVKLLKEKGFKESTRLVWYEHLPSPNAVYNSEIGKPKRDYFYWEKDGERNSPWTNDSPVPSYINGEVYSCPSHQMAIKWLREVHNIFIQMERDNQYYEGTPVTPITEHDKKRGHSSEYYAVVLDAKSNSNSFEHFDRYEEAVEAALKYSLENLI